MPIIMEPIGTIQSPFKNREDVAGSDASLTQATIKIDERYTEGIADITAGDRMMVVFYFNRSEKALLTVPLMGVGPMVGVFSSHSPDRPNFIGITESTVESVNGLQIEIRGCDMLDGTPVLDLKPIPTAHER